VFWPCAFSAFAVPEKNVVSSAHAGSKVWVLGLGVRKHGATLGPCAVAWPPALSYGVLAATKNGLHMWEQFCTLPQNVVLRTMFGFGHPQPQAPVDWPVTT
jgi:hypothetical protein